MVVSVSPKQLQPHIKDCVINNHTLMIYVSSAAWASQLRFYNRQIKEVINTQSNERIKQVRIRMISPEPFVVERTTHKTLPSSETITLLQNNAESLEEGKLKSALLRLGTTLKKQIK